VYENWATDLRVVEDSYVESLKYKSALGSFLSAARIEQLCSLSSGGGGRHVGAGLVSFAMKNDAPCMVARL
jgi:hypothetical protein